MWVDHSQGVGPRAGSEHFHASEAVAATHKGLHLALVGNSGSPRLVTMQALFFDQAQRYRDVMIGEVRSASLFVDTHAVLVDTILSKDIERACTALSEHLNLTMRDVYLNNTRPGSAT